MPDNVTLLTARRSYEFPADAIRLTVLSLQPHLQRVVEAFEFQSAVAGSPMPTFGEVPRTLPPGIAFDIGAIYTEDGRVFHVRFIHFEPRRVVIDVAGPSWVIDHVYARLRGLLDDADAPDGQPALGEPEVTLDYSEYVATYGFRADEILNPSLKRLLAGLNVTEGNGDGLMLLPSVYLMPGAADVESQGSVSQPTSKMFQFSLRAGTEPRKRTYFSGAPLDSDAHAALLVELDAALSP
jgi:hypothetical protein